jgi:hypothetical protein
MILTTLKRALTQRQPRRGTVSGIVVVSLPLLVAVLGLALELALVSHVQIQLQGACDAAALAGASELMDIRVLNPDADHNAGDRSHSARLTALRYMRANGGDAHCVVFDASAGNDPFGDLVAGWIEHPTDPDSPFVIGQGAEQCNTLQVRAQRTRQRGNPVPLWLGQLVRVAHADVAAVARATVDRRVYGFRPIGSTSVPVIPLTALEADTRDSWSTQAFASSVAGENDRYSVDYRTGEVADGPDGIPEVRLATAGEAEFQEGESGNLGGLAFRHASWDLQRIQRQILHGLSADDLSQFGGQLALDADGTLCVPGLDDPAARWAEALASIRGANRIWPLHRATTQQERLCYQLAGFAAGRMVHVEWQDGQLIVIVQPSVLATRTALVRTLRPGESPNPWIGKLFLTH